jgi:hypothetical protein
VTATIPTTEPTRLIAGDTAKWLKTLADYPASAGWALVYTLINATNKITISAAAQGDDHLVNVSKTTTAAYVAGTYDYRAQVSLGAETYTVGSGRIVVEASFGAATLDNRSSSQKMLDSVEAVMLKTAGSNVLEYEIAGRRLKHYSMGELLQLRDRLKGEVAKETAAAQLANAGSNGQSSPVGRIYVRFGG